MSFASLVALPGGLDRALSGGLAIVLSMALAASTASAQELRGDQVPVPQDTPYPGTITINVDASDTMQGTFRVHETIPVVAGAMTLLIRSGFPAITGRAAPSPCSRESGSAPTERR